MLPTFITQLKSLLLGFSAVAITVNPLSTPVITAANTTAPNSSVNVDTSRNWSGYEATGGQFTSVTGTWNIPNVSNTTTGSADAEWVGIGGIQHSDLIQSGTQAVTTNGQISYSAWYEILPQTSKKLPITVSPGDSITVSLNQQSSGVWQLNFKDNTTGQNYQSQINYNSSLSSADWIVESPSTGRGFMPLDNFGTVSFSNASTIKDGNQLNLSAANAQGITMAGNNNLALATTSAIGSDGASFTVTRTSNTSGNSVPRGTIRIYQVNPSIQRGRIIPRSRIHSYSFQRFFR